MKTCTGEGILCRHFPYGESSHIYHCYTRDHGLVSLMGKGIHRSRANKITPLEFYHVYELVYTPTQDDKLIILKENSVKYSYDNIGKSLEKGAIAQVMLETYTQHTKDVEESGPMYALLVHSLTDLNSAPESILSRDFLLRLWFDFSELHGIKPHLDTCAHCNEELHHHIQLAFSLSEGGILCGNCLTQQHSGVKISTSDWQQLKQCQNALSRNKIWNVRELDRAEELLSRFLTYHTGKNEELRSRAFLNGLRLDGV